MKLKLENFRCHKKVGFEIPDTGLVLLSGASGAGKTTILNAITYALYGKLAKPYSHDQTKCSVKIEGYSIREETLDIVRTSPGSRLKVTCRGKEYEDDAAQGVIDDLVVPYEKFLLSSYVAQRLNSSILSLPPRDQVFFIKTLASVGDCNNVFRARVQHKIGHYESRANHLKGESAVVRRQLENVPTPVCLSPTNKLLDPETLRVVIERLELDMNTCRTTVEQLEGEKTRLKDKVEQASHTATLKKQISALKKDLAQMEFCADSDFEDLESDHAFLKRAALFRTETFNLKRLENDFGRIEGQRQKTLRAGLLSLEAKESYQKEVETLRADYNAASAAAAAVAAAKKDISDMSAEVNNTWPIKLKKGPAALQSFFEKKLRQWKKMADQTRREIDDLAQKAAVEKFKRETYTCPSCDTALVFEDHKLTRAPQPGGPASEGGVDYESLILAAQEKSVQIDKDLTSLGVLSRRFSLVVDQGKLKVLSATKINLFTKKIEKIEQSLFTSEKNRQELDSLTISENIIAEHRKKADMILHAGDKKKLKDLGDLGDDDLRKRLDLIVERLSRLRLNKERVLALSSEIQEKQTLLGGADFVSPDDISRELDCVAIRLGEFHTRHQNAVLAFQQGQKDLVEALDRQTYEKEILRHNILLKEEGVLEESLRSTFGKLLGFKGLNVLCKKADIFATDASIAEINFNASLYTKDLFAEPIQIALSRVRTTLKGDQRDGMTTNVVYKGSAYSSLDQLSGGERQRCNLAFILAVNDIVGSPFLLLDECLNNLDGETHADILDFLRQTCRGKLILVVAHEAAVAKFDEVVRV